MKFLILAISLFIIQIFVMKSLEYEYIKLFEELDTLTDTSQYQWKYDQQDFTQIPDAKWPLAPKNTFTFWFKLDTADQTSTMFRLTTTDNDCCNVGDRVHGIFIRFSDLKLVFVQQDNQNPNLNFEFSNIFETEKWFFIAINMNYVETFSSEIYFFGEGNDANYLLKAFKHNIHRGGLPYGLLSKAATKVFVGYDNLYSPLIGKYKDFRFYYENQLSFDTIAEIMGVYSASYYKSLTVQEFTNAVLTEAEAQDGWTYGSTPAAYITQCNGVYLVGGYNAFGNNFISKTFTKSSAQIFTQILFTFYFIDSWNADYGDAFTFSVDSSEIQSTTVEHIDLVSVRSNICGAANTDFIGKFNYLIDHQTPTITLNFSTNLDESRDQESWGIRDIQIITWDVCDASCGTCSGPSSSECITLHANIDIECDQSCKTCSGTSSSECVTCKSGLKACINGVCQCDSSVHSELSEGQCICQSGYVTIEDECQPCDQSCETCSGTSSSECITCKSELKASINGVCQCDSSVHSELSEGQCICQTGYGEKNDKCQPCHSTCSSSCNAGDHMYGCILCDESQFREKVKSRCKCMAGYIEVNGECKNDLPQQLFLMINEIRAANGKNALFWNNKVYEDIEAQGLQSLTHPNTPYYKKLFNFGKTQTFIGCLKLTSTITVELMRTLWESQPEDMARINGDFQVGALHLLTKGQKSLLFAHFYHLYHESSCAKYKENLGDQFQDGIYPLYLASGDTVQVYCQDEWIVLERRTSADLNFNQTWNIYAAGFGDLSDDFWLGLENMHKLTLEAKTLKIELWYNNEEYATAEYSGFQIGDSSAYYPLTFDSFVGGKAGDSLENHKGNMFSAYDQDHDTDTGSCGQMFSSGWWFKNCFTMNLNGNYSGSNDYGIHYTTWKGYAQSMSQVIMKIQ